MRLHKYTKIIIALLLIGIVTIPTYAAISAADGSSFVTKAEFDNALTDINGRMNAFEKGVNQKIDARVSNYLTNKSIWNGSEQKCNVDKENLGIYRDALYIWSDTKNIANGSLANLVNARDDEGSKRLKAELPSDFVGGVKVVDEFDKSGLCFFTFEIVCPSKDGETSNKYNTAHFKEEDDGDIARSWSLGAVLTNKECEGLPLVDASQDEWRSYEIPKENIIATENWDTYFTTNNKKSMPNDVYLNFPSGTHTICGFVNKGDSLWFNVKLDFGQGSKASLYADNDFGQSAWFLTNMKAVVY